VLDNTVPHAHDEQQEEGERVSCGVQNAHYYEKRLGSNTRAAVILKVFDELAPTHLIVSAIAC
jgi:hypothetical protein